jgi:hypothetical protein
MRSNIRWLTEHANRITFRTSLRSSSMQEPRDPLLKVIICNYYVYNQLIRRNVVMHKDELHMERMCL